LWALAYYGVNALTSVNVRRLQRVATLRRKVAELTAEWEDMLAVEARQAIDAGVPITEIARLTGVSRPTIYKLIRRAPE
jgi:DNA-binding phage protein